MSLLTTIQIPKDFSWEVNWRKCDWNFPEWEVHEIAWRVLAWTFAWTSMEIKKPEICKDCKLQETCTVYATDIILWNPLPTKEQFNSKSESVFIRKTLEENTSDDTDLNTLRKCNGDLPWKEWEKWRIWKSDAFDVWLPCKECIFAISCSVQALRKLEPSQPEPRNKQDFDTFSRKRTLKYLTTGR